MPTVKIIRDFRDLMQNFVLYRKVLSLTDSRFMKIISNPDELCRLELRLYFRFLQYGQGVSPEHIKNIIQTCPVMTRA